MPSHVSVFCGRVVFVYEWVLGENRYHLVLADLVLLKLVDRAAAPHKQVQ